MHITKFSGEKKMGMTRQDTRRKEVYPLIIAIVLFVMVLMGYAVTPLIFYGVAIIILIRVFTAKNCQDVLVPFMIIAPWGAEIWSTLGGRVYTALRLATIIMFVLRYIQKKRSIPRSNFYIAIICMGIYVLIGEIFSGTAAFDSLINFVLVYIVVFFAVQDGDEIAFEKYAVAFGSGVALSGLMFYAGQFIPRLQVVVNSMIQTYGTYGANRLSRLSGMTYDPNLFGLFVTVAASSLLRLMWLKGFKKSSLLVLLVCLYILGFMTLSKGYLLVFAFATVVVFYYWLTSRNIGTGRRMRITTVVVVALIGLAPIFVQYVDAFIERFTVGSMADLTTNRSDIWRIYIEEIGRHPSILLLGTSLETVFGNHSSPHNLVIFMIYHFGIIGTALHLMMTGCIVPKRRPLKGVSGMKEEFAYMPMILYVMYCMTLDPFKLFDMKMMMLIVAFLSMKRMRYMEGDLL